MLQHFYCIMRITSSHTSRTQQQARPYLTRKHQQRTHQRTKDGPFPHFEVGLPAAPLTPPHPSRPSSPSSPSHPYHSVKRYLEQTRKQQIKQKIKTRVKEELWSLFQRAEEKDSSPVGLTSSPQTAVKYVSQPRGFSVQVRGKSYRHMPAQQKVSHNRWTSDANKTCLKNEEAKPILRRRVWSSAVKIREKGGRGLGESPVQTLKLKNVVSSAARMLQADSYEIEPWNIEENDFNLQPVRP